MKLQEFKVKGYELIVLTARGESSRSITEQYIETYLPNIFYAVHMTNKSKGQICKEQNIHILIDNNLGNISDAEKHGVIGIPLGPWNWTHKHKNNILSWKELQI